MSAALVCLAWPIAILSGGGLLGQATPPEVPGPQEAAASTLTGTWTGEGQWRKLVILGERGSFLTSDGSAQGTFRFAHTGRRSYSGYWKLSDLLGGTLTLLPSEDGDALEGVVLTDPLAVENPGRRVNLRWSRAAAGADELRLEAHGTVEQVVSEYQIEVFFERQAFENRLHGALRVVGFDDVESAAGDPVQFEADRYRASHGIRIRGAGGQYVDRAFALPQDDFIPVSPPNMYAPGPKDRLDPALPKGGHETGVTFWVRERPAAVAGFGAFFIDADFPRIGPCRLVAFDAQGRQMAVEQGFSSPHGKSVFVGMVAVNSNGAPMPVISRIEITNGDEWPPVNQGDGVTLDDFVFGLPVVR